MKILYLIIVLIFAVNTLYTSEFGAGEKKGRISDKKLGEISGIVAGRTNPGIFWIHNDSGDEPRIFAIGEDAGLIGELAVTGAAHYDFEDIGIGPGPGAGANHIYIGDIGDNDAVRKFITVYRIAEPSIDTMGQKPFGNSSVPAESIYLEYPDGARDAEAMFVDPANGDIYIVTKRELKVRVYRAEYPQAINDTTVLEYLLELPFGSMGIPGNGVTGADISTDGREILIKTYSAVYYFSRENGESIEDALAKTPKTLKYTIEPQGEGICWAADGKGFYTLSEFGSASESIFYFYSRLSNAVKKNDESKEIRVYESDGELIIGKTNDEVEIVSVSIYDICGRLAEFYGISSDEFIINKKHLGTGTFVIVIEQAGNNFQYYVLRNFI